MLYTKDFSATVAQPRGAALGTFNHTAARFLKCWWMQIQVNPKRNWFRWASSVRPVTLSDVMMQAPEKCSSNTEWEKRLV